MQRRRGVRWRGVEELGGGGLGGGKEWGSGPRKSEGGKEVRWGRRLG